MRIAFILSFAANVLIALVSLAILPSEVAITEQMKKFKSIRFN